MKFFIFQITTVFERDERIKEKEALIEFGASF